MPPSPASSYQIQAGVDGTDATVIFKITTDTVGGGLRLFADTTDRKRLELADSKIVGDGVVFLVYRRP